MPAMSFMKKPITKYLLILIILSAGFLLYFYGKIIFKPNQFLFSSDGDGIKNYYTYCYHIRHDASYTEVEGMNYPFGENFMFTDCQPFFSTILKLLSVVFPNIVNYSAGLINFLMVFSFLLTSILLFLLLWKLKVKPLLSVIGALGITVLSPQIFRMTGHLALSYSFFIPLTWLLILRFFESARKIKWSVLLLINNLIWFFIHAYLGMIAVSFTFFIWLLDFFWNFKSSYAVFAKYLLFLISIALPVLIFNMVITFSDIHTGRTTNPLGFYSYNSEIDDIFIPHHPPLKPLLDKIHNIGLKWEGWSYTGLTSIIAIITFFIISLRKSFHKKKPVIALEYFPDYFLKISLIASGILLLYAFAFPFKQFRFLLEWLSPLKSFRATGRFGWVFYFVLTTSAVYFFHHFISSNLLKKNKFFAYILLFLLPLLFVIEGWAYHKEISRDISREKNLFLYKQLNTEYLLPLHYIKSSDFQAIIPLPFYYNGSDNFSRPVQNQVLKYSLVFSYHMNLPLFSANLTRPAIPESKKITQLFSPPFYHKSIAKELTSVKPILIIRSNEQLTEYEQALLDKSICIFSNSSVSFYSLSVDSLFNNTATREIDAFNIYKHNLFEKSGFLVNDTAGFLYFQDYDKHISEHVFRGKGSMTLPKKNKNTLVTFKPGFFKKDKKYSASIWMYNARQESLSDWFRFIIEEYDAASDEFLLTWTLPPNSQVINGDWSLVEIEFSVQNPENHVAIVTEGKKEDKASFIIDDLLIRESNTLVFKIIKINESNNIVELFKNNHQIRTQQKNN